MFTHTRAHRKAAPRTTLTGATLEIVSVTLQAGETEPDEDGNPDISEWMPTEWLAEKILPLNA